MRIRTKEVNVLVLQKGQEFFAYVFPDDADEQVLSRLKCDASNPSLSFSWYDASVLWKRVKARPTTSDQEEGE